MHEKTDLNFDLLIMSSYIIHICFRVVIRVVIDSYRVVLFSHKEASAICEALEMLL